MGRVLVTGGAGFIGSHVVDALTSRGDEVTILDALVAPTHVDGAWPPYLPASVRRIHGDVRDPVAVRDALAGVDRIVHAAAYQDYRPDHSTYLAVNAAATALLFELARSAAPALRRVVFISSQAVYGEGSYRCLQDGSVRPHGRAGSSLAEGDWNPRCPVCAGPIEAEGIREGDVCEPFNMYGLSKHAGERAALLLGDGLGIGVAAARLSITVGPRQSPANLYSGALRSFSVALLHGAPVVVFEDGQQLRDFTPIGNVVQAIVRLLDDESANGPVNVGAGEATTIASLLRMVEDAVGSHASSVVTGHYRLGESRHLRSDVSRLRSFGWRPLQTLATTVEEYIAWLRVSGTWKQVRPLEVSRLVSEGAVRAVTT